MCYCRAPRRWTRSSAEPQRQRVVTQSLLGVPPGLGRSLRLGREPPIGIDPMTFSLRVAHRRKAGTAMAWASGRASTILAAWRHLGTISRSCRSGPTGRSSRTGGWRSPWPAQSLCGSRRAGRPMSLTAALRCATPSRPATQSLIWRWRACCRPDDRPRRGLGYPSPGTGSSRRTWAGWRRAARCAARARCLAPGGGSAIRAGSAKRQPGWMASHARPDRWIRLVRHLVAWLMRPGLMRSCIGD